MFNCARHENCKGIDLKNLPEFELMQSNIDEPNQKLGLPAQGTKVEGAWRVTSHHKTLKCFEIMK